MPQVMSEVRELYIYDTIEFCSALQMYTYRTPTFRSRRKENLLYRFSPKIFFFY